MMELSSVDGGRCEFLAKVLRIDEPAQAECAMQSLILMINRMIISIGRAASRLIPGQIGSAAQ